MAEGTTRVDRTGGEPIAAQLEWTAARIEPYGERPYGDRPGHGQPPYGERREAAVYEPPGYEVYEAPEYEGTASRYRGRQRGGARQLVKRMRDMRESKGPSPEVRKEALRRDIEENRRIVAEIVTELDERRRELMDAGLQFRRHRTTLLAGALGVAVLVGTSVYLVVRRQQLRQRPMARARRFAYALERMADRPEAVARLSPSLREKALGSAAGGAAGVLAKKLAERIASMV